MYTQPRNQNVFSFILYSWVVIWSVFGYCYQGQRFTRLHQKGFLFISWFLKINTAVILVGVESHSHYFINFGHTVHVCVSWEETSSHCDSKWIKTLALYGGYKAWYELSSMKRTNFTLYFRSNLDMPLLR